MRNDKGRGGTSTEYNKRRDWAEETLCEPTKGGESLCEKTKRGETICETTIGGDTMCLTTKHYSCTFLKSGKLQKSGNTIGNTMLVFKKKKRPLFVFKNNKHCVPYCVPGRIEQRQRRENRRIAKPQRAGKRTLCGTTQDR